MNEKLIALDKGPEHVRMRINHEKIKYLQVNSMTDELFQFGGEKLGENYISGLCNLQMRIHKSE